MAQSLACTGPVIRAKRDNVHLSALLISKVNLIEAQVHADISPQRRVRTSICLTWAAES